MRRLAQRAFLIISKKYKVLVMTVAVTTKGHPPNPLQRGTRFLPRRSSEGEWLIQSHSSFRKLQRVMDCVRRHIIHKCTTVDKNLIGNHIFLESTMNRDVGKTEKQLLQSPFEEGLREMARTQRGL